MTILRVTGEDFDVDAFLGASSLAPDDVFHRGDKGRLGKTLSDTGFTIVVTEGFGRLDDHTGAAAEFLREHELELSRLRQFPGVTRMCLDFGYDRRPEAAIQCDCLPPHLLALAGSLGIGIELSLYQSVDET
jgi:hypothetical protein